MMLLKYLAAAAAASVTILGAAYLVTVERNQRAVLKELQEIKALLQSRPAAAATGTPRTGQPTQRQPADTFPPNLALTVDPGAVKGRPDAKVTIIEFSDFECPFCGRYVRDTFAQIERAYITTGKVRYAYRHFPLER